VQPGTCLAVVGNGQHLGDRFTWSQGQIDAAWADFTSGGRSSADRGEENGPAAGQLCRTGGIVIVVGVEHTIGTIGILDANSGIAIDRITVGHSVILEENEPVTGRGRVGHGVQENNLEILQAAVMIDHSTPLNDVSLLGCIVPEIDLVISILIQIVPERCNHSIGTAGTGDCVVAIVLQGGGTHGHPAIGADGNLFILLAVIAKGKG